MTIYLICRPRRKNTCTSFECVACWPLDGSVVLVKRYHFGQVDTYTKQILPLTFRTFPKRMQCSCCSLSPEEENAPDMCHSEGSPTKVLNIYCMLVSFMRLTSKSFLLLCCSSFSKQLNVASLPLPFSLWVWAFLLSAIFGWIWNLTGLFLVISCRQV